MSDFILKKIEKRLTDGLERQVERLITLSESSSAKPAEQISAIRELIKLQTDLSDRNDRKRLANLKFAMTQVEYKLKLAQLEEVEEKKLAIKNPDSKQKSREFDPTYSENAA